MERIQSRHAIRPITAKTSNRVVSDAPLVVAFPAFDGKESITVGGGRVDGTRDKLGEGSLVPRVGMEVAELGKDAGGVLAGCIGGTLEDSFFSVVSQEKGMTPSRDSGFPSQAGTLNQSARAATAPNAPALYSTVGSAYV